MPKVKVWASAEPYKTQTLLPTSIFDSDGMETANYFEKPPTSPMQNYKIPANKKYLFLLYSRVAEARNG